MGQNTTNALSKKDSIKLIKEAYAKLEFLNNYTWTPYRDNLFDINKADEKQHDRLRPDSCPRGISISDSAKLFTVCWIAEYLEGKKAPDAKDFLFVRKSAYYAYALFANYEADIRKAWKGLDISAIANLDYAKLQEA